jgi:hypothetical protein
LDGKNIWPLISGERGAVTPHESFLFYHSDQLQAIRSGPWKLFLPLTERRIGPNKVDKGIIPARLYDVVQDPAEKNDVAAQHPDVVQRLRHLAAAASDDIGDLGKQGRGQRAAGWVHNADGPRMKPKP